MRVRSLMVSVMGLVRSITVRVENMWETGDKIKCMEKASFIILIKKLLTMASGKTTS